MKYLIYSIGLFIASVLTFAACEKVDIETYSGEDAIFFAQQWGTPHFENSIDWGKNTSRNAMRGYSKVGFGELQFNDSLLNIHVLTTGYVRDYDRPFAVEVVADSTTAIEGTEYELLDPNPVIRAGEAGTIVRLLVHKSPRMDEECFKIQLRLVPGQHFVLPFGKEGVGKMPIIAVSADTNHEYGDTNEDASIHNIYVHNFLVKPGRWNEYNMGEWNEKKYRLILNYTEELLGWTAYTWAFNNDLMWPPGNGYQIGLNFLGKYLKEQYDKGPEYWVLDPDGTMMWCNHAALKGLWSEDTRPETMVK